MKYQKVIKKKILKKGSVSNSNEQGEQWRNRTEINKYWKKKQMRKLSNDK